MITHLLSRTLLISFLSVKIAAVQGVQNNRPQVCTLQMYNRKLTENKRICYDKFRMEKQLTGRILLLFPLKI